MAPFIYNKKIFTNTAQIYIKKFFLLECHTIMTKKWQSIIKVPMLYIYYFIDQWGTVQIRQKSDVYTVHNHTFKMCRPYKKTLFNHIEWLHKCFCENSCCTKLHYKLYKLQNKYVQLNLVDSVVTLIKTC